MKLKSIKSLAVVLFLIAITCIAMAYSKRENKPLISLPQNTGDILNISGNLVQNKILTNSDGKVSLSLTIKTNKVNSEENLNNVDMVIVLDRSGSMGGEKINYAKQSILNLLSRLTDNDRFAIVSYSDNAYRHTNLVNVTESNRRWLSSIILQIFPNGNTNLGQGLQEGIDLIVSSSKTQNLKKLILISDGLANRGITDIESLSSIASKAVEKAFTISSIGVGSDYNEILMTAIANNGTGNYYYLENPMTFAAIFEKEFHESKSIVARAIEVIIPLNNGINLVEASGFPIRVTDNNAIFYPGDLISGQSKKLFLTFNMPTDKERTFEISNIIIRYLYNDKSLTASIKEPFNISCVNDESKVIGSIDKKIWEEKVLQEDYSQLKNEIAGDIRTGKKEDALNKIKKYSETQNAANKAIGSSVIEQNIGKDINQLKEVVTNTFCGSAMEVEQKQKSNAKSLQFQGYLERRK